MNAFFNIFNIHILSYDEFKITQRKINHLNKTKKINKILRDINRGLKKKELLALYANVERIDEILDTYLPMESIFVPF
jgi:hypothetical protein